MMMSSPPNVNYRKPKPEPPHHNQYGVTESMKDDDIYDKNIETNNNKYNAATTESSSLSSSDFLSAASAVLTSSAPTERQRFELGLLNVKSRLSHQKRRPEEVHCLFLSASTLTRSIVTTQLKHLSWGVVESCSRLAEGDEMVVRRMKFAASRHSDPMVRMLPTTHPTPNVVTTSLAAVTTTATREEDGANGNTSSETAINSSGGNNTVSSKIKSRPIPPSDYVHLVLVDAYLHEHYTDAAASFARLQRIYGGTIITVLLTDPRPTEGLGLKLLPELVVEPSEGYAAGYDLVLPRAFDHTCALFLTEVFLPASARWQDGLITGGLVEKRGGGGGNGRVSNYNQIRFLLGEVKDRSNRNNEGGNGGGFTDPENKNATNLLLTRAAFAETSSTSPAKTQSQSQSSSPNKKGVLLARGNQQQQLQSGEDKTAVVDNSLFLASQSASHSPSASAIIVPSARERGAAAAATNFSQKQQQVVVSNPADCIDTNPDFIRLLSRYEHSLLSLKRLKEKLQHLTSSHKFLQDGHKEKDELIANLNNQLALAMKNGGGGGFGGKRKIKRIGENGEEIEEEIDPAAILEALMREMGVSSAEEVVDALEKAKTHRLEDAGHINTLTIQITKLRKKISDSQKELQELEELKKKQHAKIKELSEELEDIRDGNAGVFGKRAQLEARVKAQSEEIVLLSSFILDLKELFNMLPDKIGLKKCMGPLGGALLNDSELIISGVKRAEEEATLTTYPKHANFMSNNNNSNNNGKTRNSSSSTSAVNRNTPPPPQPDIGTVKVKSETGSSSPNRNNSSAAANNNNNTSSSNQWGMLSPEFLSAVSQQRARRMSQATILKAVAQSKQIDDLHKELSAMQKQKELLENEVLLFHDSNQDFSVSRRGTMMNHFNNNRNSSLSASQAFYMDHIHSELMANIRPFQPMHGPLYSMGTKADKGVMTEPPADDDSSNHRSGPTPPPPLPATADASEEAGDGEKRSTSNNAAIITVDDLKRLLSLWLKKQNKQQQQQEEQREGQNGSEVEGNDDDEALLALWKQSRGSDCGDGNASPTAAAVEADQLRQFLAMLLLAATSKEEEEEDRSGAPAVKNSNNNNRVLCASPPKVRPPSATHAMPPTSQASPQSGNAPFPRRGGGNDQKKPLSVRQQQFAPPFPSASSQQTPFSGLLPHALPSAVASPYLRATKPFSSVQQ